MSAHATAHPAAATPLRSPSTHDPCASSHAWHTSPADSALGSLRPRPPCPAACPLPLRRSLPAPRPLALAWAQEEPPGTACLASWATAPPTSPSVDIPAHTRGLRGQRYRCFCHVNARVFMPSHLYTLTASTRGRPPRWVAWVAGGRVRCRSGAPRPPGPGPFAGHPGRRPRRAAAECGCGKGSDGDKMLCRCDRWQRRCAGQTEALPGRRSSEPLT